MKFLSNLSNLFNTVKRDLTAEFDTVKRRSLLAKNSVEVARAELTRAIERTAELAEQTRTAAEAAANHASAEAQRLAQEARAAAESADYHRSLIERKTPTLD